MEISQALRAAQNRTSYILWQNGSSSRWLKMGLLACLAGATPNIRLDGLGDLPMDKPEVAALLLVFIGCLVVFSLFMGWVACTARFTFLENIVYNRDAVLEPSWRLKGLGTRVFGFYISVLFAMIALFVGVAILFGGGAFLFAGKMSEGTAAALGVGLVGLILMVMLPLILVLTVLFGVTDDFVVPIMYRDNCGVLEAFGKLKQTVKGGGYGNFALWFLCRMAVSAVWGIMYLIIALIIAALTGLLAACFAAPIFMIGHLEASQPGGIAVLVLAGLSWLAISIPLWLLFASPGIVYTKCFSIYMLQDWDPATQLLPASGLGTVLEPVAEPQQPAGFNRPEACVE